MKKLFLLGLVLTLVISFTTGTKSVTQEDLAVKDAMPSGGITFEDLALHDRFTSGETYAITAGSLDVKPGLKDNKTPPSATSERSKYESGTKITWEKFAGILRDMYKPKTGVAETGHPPAEGGVRFAIATDGPMPTQPGASPGSEPAPTADSDSEGYVPDLDVDLYAGNAC